MRITVAAQKGGTGKTTVSINIALALAGLPKAPKVALIDADEQRSCAEVLRKNTRGNLTVYEAPEEPHVTINGLEEKLIVTDTPPHTSRIMRLAAAASDLVLIPLQPSPLDVRGIRPTVDNLLFIQEKREEKGRRPLHCRFLLNRIKPRTKLSATARATLAKLYPFPVLENELHDREIYKQAIGMGRSVIEHDKSSAAAQELGRLILEVNAIIKDISL